VKIPIACSLDAAGMATRVDEWKAVVALATGGATAEAQELVAALIS
jgi:hypothetical protein